MVHIHNLSVINISGEPRRPFVTVLPTAVITLHTNEGTYPVRVLLSLESWQNFITEECLKKFDLPLLGGAPPIQVLDGKMKHILGKTHINISSRFDEENIRNLEVLVTEHILSMVPSAQLHTSVKEPLLYFQLADPTFDKPGEIDILLGRDLLSDILKEDEYRIPDTYCFTHDTIFGWIVIGGAPVEDEPEQFLHKIEKFGMDNAMKAFPKEPKEPAEECDQAGQLIRRISIIHLGIFITIAKLKKLIRDMRLMLVFQSIHEMQEALAEENSEQTP